MTMMLALFVLLKLLYVSAQAAVPFKVQDSPDDLFTEDVKVPVVLGVMSRCPDALLCEAVWDRVLQRVSDKVDISLSFIATLDPSDTTYGVRCMHGLQECAGNVYELCVAKYHPTSEWWPFLQCQNFNGLERIGLPETAASCAETAGFQWKDDKANLCAGEKGQGEEGAKLLQESVQNTLQLGIKKSCTIMINGEQVCIRDGTWYECEGGHTDADFIRQVNEEYGRLNSHDLGQA